MSSTSVQIPVKWGKESYTIDVNDPVTMTLNDFKAQLEELTSVPADRQKLVGLKGGGATTSSSSESLSSSPAMSSFMLKPVPKVTLIGAAAAAAATTAAAAKAGSTTVFSEDDTSGTKGSGAVVGMNGLKNIGNTCYLSSAIQILRIVPEVRQQLAAAATAVTPPAAATPASGGGSTSSSNNGVARPLGQLMQELDNTREPVAPLRLWGTFIIQYPEFGTVNERQMPMQHDSQEALAALLNSALGGTSSSSSSSSSASSNPKLAHLFNGTLQTTRSLSAEEASTVVARVARERTREARKHLEDADGNGDAGASASHQQKAPQQGGRPSAEEKDAKTTIAEVLENGGSAKPTVPPPPPVVTSSDFTILPISLNTESTPLEIVMRSSLASKVEANYEFPESYLPPASPAASPARASAERTTATGEGGGEEAVMRNADNNGSDSGSESGSATSTPSASSSSPLIKVQAEYKIESLFSQLPEYLCLQLTRFTWRHDINRKTKNIKPVTFPFTLDVNLQCTEELRRSMEPAREALKVRRDNYVAKKRGRNQQYSADVSKPAAEDEDAAAAGQEEGEKDSPPETLGNTNGYYELCGVISHLGRDAEGGHYVAWVKRGQKWIIYDDENAAVVSADDVGRLRGRGEGHIAYVLLYRSRDPETFAPPLDF